jgi:hypothetical protein
MDVQNAPIVRRWIGLALMIVLAAGGAACETLIGDSATRVAYAVRDGAARLARSPSDTLVLSVAWRSWPDGCPDGYRVQWNADTDQFPGLSVICTTGRRSYSTTHYRNFVKVPRSLQVTKEKGEPVAIALRKLADGTIEVVAVQ